MQSAGMKVTDGRATLSRLCACAEQMRPWSRSKSARKNLHNNIGTKSSLRVLLDLYLGHSYTSA